MAESTAAIASMLVENRVFEPNPELVAQARVSGMEAYHALCAEAEADYEGFWARRARELLVWHKPFTQVLDQSNKPFYRWFQDGELNASVNCLDRHIGTPVENKTAIIFEADDGAVTRITYKELLARVSQFANALKAMGVRKGDRVVIYMPMTIEGVVAMQACARIGATHSVVFGGFSAGALKDRIRDAGAVAVITANYQMRGGKELPLKAIVDEAIALGGCETVRQVVVFQRTPTACHMEPGRDVWMHDALAGQPTECPAEMVGAEHPLFILYTSGSTGKPKGVQHSTGGYLLWAKQTMLWTFDLKDSDVFWCTADIGWITGHTYVAYGPLAAGATQIVFEGVPTYPHAGRFWQMIEKHGCTIFYTAPTAIRSLIKASDTDEKVHPKNWNLSTLRILGSVGEPINPEAWMWYYRHVGGERCPIVDTFWQTETGGHMITPLPGATPLVPGSCTLPLPGIAAAIVDEQGNDMPSGQGGILVIKKPWPSMIRTIWGDPERFQKSYFPEELKGYYLAGDGAVRSEDVATSASPAASTTCSTSAATAWARWRSNRPWWPRPTWWRKPPSWGDPMTSPVRPSSPSSCSSARCRRGKKPGPSPTSCATGWPRKSGPSPSRRTFALAKICPRHAQARSCVACCAPSPRARPSPKTSRHWKIRTSWSSWPRPTEPWQRLLRRGAGHGACVGQAGAKKNGLPRGKPFIRCAWPPRRRRAHCRHFRPNTQVASFFASASLTCGLAGMGIAPHTPAPPFWILVASMSAALASPAYFLAMSLYDGPTSFLSTAWQAVQFLALARASSARAGPEMAAVAAKMSRARFMVSVLVEG